MKIQLTREKKNLFFAKLSGIEGVYAQGESVQDCIENLLEIYEQVIQFKKHVADKTPVLQNIYKQSGMLNELGFSRLEFSL